MFISFAFHFTAPRLNIKLSESAHSNASLSLSLSISLYQPRTFSLLSQPQVRRSSRYETLLLFSFRFVEES